MQEFVEVVFRSERVGFFINNKGLELSPDLNVVVKVERGEDIGRVSNCAVLDDDPSNCNRRRFETTGNSKEERTKS